jgi:hypothetical protein
VSWQVVGRSDAKEQQGAGDARSEPYTYESPVDAPALKELHVTEAFEGDLEGTGVVRFLQAMRGDGSASFVGIERVSGTLADKTGTFLLQHEGTASGESIEGRWFVIEGSGTNGLEGLRGEGTFSKRPGQNAQWVLDYYFERG